MNTWKTVDFRSIPHGCLEVEITERLLAEDPSRTLNTQNEIRDMGFKIAIDDFGTGYSSLSYIRRFPLDRLKIDRAFVVNLAESEEDRLIATAIASLAHVLGLEVIAEGVETPEQASFLKSIDCEFFQGYMVSKPIPLAEFAAFVQSNAQKSAIREHVDLKVFSTNEDRAVKPVTWKRSFSTDVTSVDDEHRVLVVMLNDLTDQLLDPETDVDIEAALNEIGKETLEHFAHEERVMENIHYDRINSHRQKHQDLIADFTRRREELLAAFRDGELVELVNYLKFWLLRHLISEDTRLHRFLNHHPAGQA